MFPTRARALGFMEQTLLLACDKPAEHRAVQLRHSPRICANDKPRDGRDGERVSGTEIKTSDWPRCAESLPSTRCLLLCFTGRHCRNSACEPTTSPFAKLQFVPGNSHLQGRGLKKCVPRQGWQEGCMGLVRMRIPLTLKSALSAHSSPAPCTAGTKREVTQSQGTGPTQQTQPATSWDLLSKAERTMGEQGFHVAGVQVR